jgi:hypothetical protein
MDRHDSAVEVGAMGPMRFARFSLASLVAAIGLCGVGMACLMFASTPWAGMVPSITLAILILAPLRIIYRRGERRAFWTGAALCGWSYMILSSGPWFVDAVRPRLVTSRLLQWSYPWMVPAARLATNPRLMLRPFVIPLSSLDGGPPIGELYGSRVDVWVKGDDEANPSLLVEDALAVSNYSSGMNVILKPALMTDADQFAKLTRAEAHSKRFTLEPHRPGPFDSLWSSPLVSLRDFEDVGHPLFGLLCAWIGGMAGRYAFATRERGAVDTPGAGDTP